MPAIGLALILALLLPGIAFASRNAIDIEGAYVFTLPASVYDMDGTRSTSTYRYALLDITEQEDEVVTEAYLYLLARKDVRGCYITNGTTTFDPPRRGARRLNLVFDENEVVALDTGTLNVYLPVGYNGYVVDGLVGQIEGGSQLLTYGWDEITVTTAGDIFVYVWIDMQLIGSVHGIVGYGRAARFMLAGPELVTKVTPGTASIDGLMLSGQDFHRVVAPGGAFVVSGSGTFNVDMPYGNYGTVTGSGGLTIDGEASQDLFNGTNSFTTGATTGNLHINVATELAFQLNGMVRQRVLTSTVTGLKGRLEGVLVTETDPWNAIVLSCPVSARPAPWWVVS